MENDISVCILTYLGVNGDLQGQKLVREADFAPKSRISNLMPEYFSTTSSITIYGQI